MRVLSMSTGGAHVSNNSCYSFRSWTFEPRHEELTWVFSYIVLDLAYYFSSIFTVHGQTEKTVARLSMQWRLHLTLPLNLRRSRIWEENTFRGRSGDSI